MNMMVKLDLFAFLRLTICQMVEGSGNGKKPLGKLMCFTILKHMASDKRANPMGRISRFVVRELVR